MPFHTEYGSVLFSKALFVTLVRLGCLDRKRSFDDSFVNTLLDMANHRDIRLFDAIRMTIEDIDEIALVIFAEDTAFFVDQGDNKKNFWDKEHWFSDEKWNDALQMAAESKYASEATRQHAIKLLAPHPGFVYLVSCEEGYCKIGRSVEPDRRLLQFHTLPPFEFELEHTIKADNDIEAENKLHQRFSDKRANGEWFKLGGPEINLIKSISEYKRGAFYTADNQKLTLGKREPSLLSLIARLLQKVRGGNTK